jgi:hypothetical protein
VILLDISLDDSQRFDTFYLECRIICADGTTRWISERGRPAYNLEGQILWIDGVMFDITNRKKAELTLHQVTQAVDSASDAIAIAITTPIRLRACWIKFRK